ncbi:hypothetical protein ACIBG7_33715 [Nonomuraea sp. NPDC050328]|uniref:hypothetical protein n=1 Tax=Nonomuraea sp. NPDC050328 TaxID=3364361 RepID=UPI0037ACF226
MDGSYLTVTPVPCKDSVGVPYEITLALHRDGSPYGTVGERCGWFLARLARGVDEARAEASWPDPEDRFPDDGELFAFRYRTRLGSPGGELRCQLRTIPIWQPEGRWLLTRRAYLEAWGTQGVGLRAVLSSSELAAFVGELLAEAEACLGGRDLARNPIEGAGSH